MKYLVTMQFNRADGVDNISDLIEQGKAYFQSQAQSGKLDCAYATLNHPAKVIAIVSADSNEEALQGIASNPLAAISVTTVDALAEVSSVFDSNQARVSG